MRNTSIVCLALAASLVASTSEAALLAAWNFNSLSIAAASAPGSGGVPTSIAASSGTGSLSLTPYGGLVDDFGGTTINAVMGDAAEESLSLVAGASPNFPGNGTSIVYSLSTTGFGSTVLTYASQRTGTGFTSQAWEYSLDGSTYLPVSTVGSLPAAFALQTVNLPAATDNQGSLFVRLTVTGATSASGNNRLDNVQFNATEIPEPGTCALAGLALMTIGVVARKK